MLLDKDRKPYFENYVNSEDTFFLSFARKKIKKIHIKYYENNFETAYPSFKEKTKKIDLIPTKTWSVIYDKNKAFTFEREGVYFLQTDTSTSKGFLILNKGKSFPFIKNSQDMAESLTYISNEQEYKSINNAEIKKFAIDRFWLRATGNLERSKELIKVYYNRIFWSNVYFSSYKKGWKTDRGMIYTIYGQPSKIYKSNSYEKWIYDNKNIVKAYSFVFKKEKKSMSNNSYSLIRSNFKKDDWLNAIDTWRNGQVFSLILN